MPRPYRFHVCANWQSAPGVKQRSAPFPPDTAVGKWRDLVLTWPRPGFSKTPGEDFFYVQEVRAPEVTRSRDISVDRYSDAKSVGRWAQ
jgi:protein phosphatase PTC7